MSYIAVLMVYFGSLAISHGPRRIEPREWVIYTAVTCRHEGISVSETAEIVGYSDGWVSEMCRDWQSGDDHKEVVNRVAEEIDG